MTVSSLMMGAERIRDYAKTLPDQPGVYRMMNKAGDVLYVGKARSLKKRVVTYSRVEKLPRRLQRMVSEMEEMEFVTTSSEVEALLLECNLIKKFYPRYNILLKDDKSFPYICLSEGHPFPQISKHRGSRTQEHRYFGPFASTSAVNETIDLLQKIFRLRPCTDSYFAARKRPCLQYHIKRCSAPCVAKISAQDYAQEVQQCCDFLEGKSRLLQENYEQQMTAASAAMDYERAALYRDRIKALSAVQVHQTINLEGMGDCDVVAVARQEGKICVQIFFFRGGQNFGNRAYYPRHDAEESIGAVLSGFLLQFYARVMPPPEILLSDRPHESDLLQQALTHLAGRRVVLFSSVRGTRRRVVEFAARNAREALDRKLQQQHDSRRYMDALAELFEMDSPPQRIEVYDNSHISGTNMVGGMVVAGEQGFRKPAYRTFNIHSTTAGDDYGMMREVIARRFRAVDEKNTAEWPDLLLIDGGIGQLRSVCEVLQEKGIKDRVCVVAISKGPDRNAGREQFFIEGREPFRLPEDDPVLHYLQRLRDEAHRFAIGTHRARRTRDLERSPLDEIEGIGPTRKKALLHHFGSGKAIQNAGIEDLCAVKGISRTQAEKIYSFFHNC